MRGLSVLLFTGMLFTTIGCGHGVVESRPLTTDFDGYRSGAVEVEPVGLDSADKGGERFKAYLESHLKKNGVLDPLPIDQGGQMTVRVRAGSNNSGEDDIRVLVDFIDGRSRQTFGQITVAADRLDHTGASMRRIADEIVAYMRSHRRAPVTAKRGPAPEAIPVVTDDAPVAGIATIGSCTTTCVPDATSALPPEDRTRLAHAFQPILKDVRVCLDRISAQAIAPAVILRFEGAGGTLTQLKVDAGGYDEIQCVQDARSRPPTVSVSRAASVRCEYRCAK